MLESLGDQMPARGQPAAVTTLNFRQDTDPSSPGGPLAPLPRASLISLRGPSYTHRSPSTAHPHPAQLTPPTPPHTPHLSFLQQGPGPSPPRGWTDGCTDGQSDRRLTFAKS